MITFDGHETEPNYRALQFEVLAQRHLAQTAHVLCRQSCFLLILVQPTGWHNERMVA